LCGTFGNTSFFSGQWNKPFSSGLGGILLVNDNSFLHDLESIYDQAENVSFAENVRLKTQIMAYNTIITPRTNAMITDLYRFLSRIGIAAGSSSNEELEGKMPSGYFKKMAPCQIKEGEKNLRHIQRSIDARKKNTKIYSIELKKIGFKPLRETPDFDSIILRYPLRVANKKEVLRLAARYRLEIGSWFEVTLHPEGTDMTALGYHEGMCPNAEKASREVINLPTHHKITQKEISRIIEFLKRNAKPAA
jgi:dTDP-4-amino-4,6-dideoxygalactose transaminase